MKFGKNLLQVVELSDPEWGPFWMNYKYLKKKINDIVDARSKVNVPMQDKNDPSIIAMQPGEGEFFRAVKTELKKASEFFDSSQQLVKIRHERVVNGYKKLLEDGKKYDKNTWSRLLRACVKFYKDVLLLENFAIMNYCGFSKILKKHDKQTGFRTREAFMRNVMSVQNFTNYPYIQEMLRVSEKMFEEMQKMDSVMPLQEEERLFIDAIRNLNYEAGQLQAEENSTSSNGNSDGSDGSADTNAVDSTGTDFIDPLNRKRTLSVASDASMLRTPAAVLQQDLLIPLSEISSRRVGVQDSPACRLDSAADAATVLASRLKHSDGTSNAQVESALSWMNAINQRPSDAPRMVTMGRADGSQSPSSGRISACNSDAESSIGAHGVPDMRPSDTHMENVETPNKKQCTADV